MNTQEPSLLNPPEDARSKTLPGAEGQNSRLRVLIVEDDDTQREILCDIIQKEGYDPVACSSAAEVLALTGLADFAVAIVDLRLPDMDGTELLQRLHQANPSVRVIIHTGFSSYESARDALNIGAVAYVEKLGGLEELIEYTNIAARAWMAEMLRQTQENYQQIVDSVTAIIWRRDPQTKAFTFVSQEAQVLLGYPVERWLNEPLFWQDLVHAQDRERALAWSEQITEADGPHELEYRMIQADGHVRWLRDTARVQLRDGQPTALVGVMVDITERKQAEEALRKLNEELEQRVVERTAQLEAKNIELERFTYTVSHDLKSPLVTVKGFLGLLQQDAARGDTERMQHDIEQIHAAADKMKHLLDDLLELSRIGRLMNPPEAVSLTSLAHEAVALVTGRIAERGVVVEIAPEMPVVHVDRFRLLEVLQNLIDNAVKYMGEQPAPHVEIGAEVHDEAVVCSVRDNGIGIDPRHHERIFGLFEQLDQKMEGTGIGLALVQRIVEVHGGRIWVESEGEGHGSTFCFMLPAQSPSEVRE